MRLENPYLKVFDTIFSNNIFKAKCYTYILVCSNSNRDKKKLNKSKPSKFSNDQSLILSTVVISTRN